jgi:hypothetical protein
VATASWLSRIRTVASDPASAVRRFIFALVPVGVSMWAAHLVYHLVTSGAGAWPAVERMMSGSIQSVAMAYLPTWLTPLQLLTLDAGLMLSLYVCWRTGKQVAPVGHSAVAVTWPWLALTCTLYAAGIWILFQPMQMRGMVH